MGCTIPLSTSAATSAQNKRSRVYFCEGIYLIQFFFNGNGFLTNNNTLIKHNKTCLGFLAQCRQNNLFSDRILWTDEATLTPNGTFNSHNFMTWQEENSHAIR